MKIEKSPIALFLPLVLTMVLFASPSAWCDFTTYLPVGSPVLTGCDLLTGFPGSGPINGIVVLPNGTVLVASDFVGLYAFQPPADCSSPKATATLLSSAHIIGMALNPQDGQVYGLERTTGDFVRIDQSTGALKHLASACTPPGPAGVAFNPFDGNMYVTEAGTIGSGVGKVMKVTGYIYPSLSATCSVWSDLQAQGLTVISYLDGLAWSCDGTYLLVADTGSQIFKILPNYPNNITGTAKLYVAKAAFTASGSSSPDGIAFGQPGTSLFGSAYTNNKDGSLTRIRLSTVPVVSQLATGNSQGDFVTVDSKGRLLATTHSTPENVTMVYSTGVSGGGFILPGSSLCSSLNCMGKAVTTPSNACLPPGVSADLIITLSQASCSECADCATLNQARKTLIELGDLDQPCLDPLIIAAKALYRSCPCNPAPGACVYSCPTCTNTTKVFEGLDFDFGDPIIQQFRKQRH